jgi:cysteinyl-tRNA synthetase
MAKNYVKTNENVCNKSLLKLYNTMSKKIEQFEPLNGNCVGMYTCGPTVYNYAHIGNLRTYIFEDILKRVLIFSGYSVNHIMNVTDVGHLVSDSDIGEDKMEIGANREGKSILELANYYWQAFRKDLSLLNIIEPNIWCKATEHISEQIRLIKGLEEKGFTYIIEDGLYFDTSKLHNYGRLARLDIEGLKAGIRVEMAKNKRNSTDFALWKFSPKDKKRLMSWDSPWGEGFPGWHIECSAMALKYLGDEFDIHCGGIDHIPVHHTNEIAQTESFTGKKWVRFWMHGEFLVLSKDESNDKMSKSGNNFITLNLLKERGFDPISYRYFCLNAHYRNPLTFSWEAIKASNNAIIRLKNYLMNLKHSIIDIGNGKVNGHYLNEFTQAISDDLNMPIAVATMWNLLSDKMVSPEDKYLTFLEMDKVLGFNAENLIKDSEKKQFENDSIEIEFMEKIKEREEARKMRNFALADKIRNELAAVGILVEDTNEGPKVKKVNID